MKYYFGYISVNPKWRRDPNPSWRCLAWNEDNQLLAIAYSDGNIEICDTVGLLLFLNKPENISKNYDYIIYLLANSYFIGLTFFYVCYFYLLYNN